MIVLYKDLIKNGSIKGMLVLMVDGIVVEVEDGIVV